MCFRQNSLFHLNKRWINDPILGANSDLHFSPLCVLAEQPVLLVEWGLVWRDVKADAPEVGQRVRRADVVVVC